ncbi:hypothetical protein SpCBS45565_g07241 [Spizellomyces sp. 'palustris']|nr:hypothetical protein SpCBS45565_g07241 [Spizellomyces sp. 'palustris']
MYHHPSYNQSGAVPPLPPRRDSDGRPPYVAFPSPGSQYGPAHNTTAPYPTPAYPTPISSPYGFAKGYPHGDYRVPSNSVSYPSSTPTHSAHASFDFSKVADIEKQLQQEREERRKLEDREVERIKSISLLENQLRSMTLDMDRTAERAGIVSQIESKLQFEQDEKRKLEDRLATTAQLESRLDHEQSERQRLEERLASYPATIAELERKIALEKADKKKLEERVASMAALEPLLKAEQDEKHRLEKRLPEVESQLRASQKALTDLGFAKADMERNIESKNREIASLKKQLDPQSMDEQRKKLEDARLELEQLVKAKDEEISTLIDNLNHEAYERTAVTNQLHLLQMRYEPHPPPVGDDSVYTRPPPTQPLAVPKGVDHELWQLFVMVDPYQLKAINAVQLRDILLHGPWPALEYSTVQILYAIYDRSGTGFKFEQFTALWDLIHEWLEVFREFDHHQNETEFGHVDRKDLRNVLKKCGIITSERSLTSLLTKGYQQEQPLGWDDFLRCAARLKIIMDTFQKIDMDKDNWITISRDQFMELVIGSI